MPVGSPPMAELPYSDDALSLLRPRAKVLLRKRMRQLRGTLPAEARNRRSAAIAARVLALPCWQAARSVALYASMPDEFDTRALLDDAVARGLDVALPVVGEGRVLSFRWLVRGGQRFPTAVSAFGIDEPTEEAPEVDLATLDVVIVPALAMDPRGHRLGFGRALYDNTLVLMTRAARVATVFAFQMIAEVPNEAHDQRVHFIVTDEDTYRVDDAP
ncbi:MAG: 5-formyltetrahydrofolate cyclo-ligase [Myxococcaceae bacterium]|nr:MAG: 5-formyltetrahydrofolate cyclo-ligase [Myxococcaceae bacterium]